MWSWIGGQEAAARLTRLLEAEREARRAAALPSFDEACGEVMEEMRRMAEEKRMEGRKDDQGKPRMELLPGDALNEIAKVLTFGAAKYEDRNWERGMKWGRPFGALMRHMWAWWQGEDKDPETGLSHLAHAACCILFLLSYELRKTGEDDRPK